MNLSIFSPPGTLASIALIDISIQWLGWGISAFFRTEKYYDLTGSSTFILLAGLCYKWHAHGHPRQLIQTGAVVVWGLRLGLFLFSRILAHGQDRRFNKIRDDPARFFFAWTIQGVWVFVTLLPTLLCVTSRRHPALCTRDYVGWGVWLLGFLLETVADHQKTVFRRQPGNGGKFISSGLWSLSRHPNYFGEILLWFGLYISASSSFSGYDYLSIFSPTLVYMLITRVSGIPLLENHALKKWGTSPLYQKYLRETPVLVPFWH